jgi:hypothetical protein
LCKFSKPWYIQKFNFIQKENFFGFWPIRPSPAPALARSAQAALAYFLKGVFSLTLRTSVETPSLSHVTAMWGPPVSFIPFPTPVDRCRFFSSPPATPRRPASNLRMPSKVFTPRIDSPS